MNLYENPKTKKGYTSSTQKYSYLRSFTYCGSTITITKDVFRNKWLRDVTTLSHGKKNYQRKWKITVCVTSSARARNKKPISYERIESWVPIRDLFRSLRILTQVRKYSTIRFIFKKFNML